MEESLQTIQPPSAQQPVSSQADGHAYHQALEAAVESILLWTQATIAVEHKPDSEEDKAVSAKIALTTLERQFSFLKLEVVMSALQELLHEACQQEWSPKLAEQMSGVGAMASMTGKALQCLISQSLQLHKSSSKLTYISSSIFAGLLKEGFCTVEEGQEEAGGEGGGNFQEAEGTGMGEGEGGKDISDQIENEDQLLGAQQKDAPEDQEKEEQDLPEEGEKGIEMEADFDGKYEDIPENEDDSADEEQEGDEDRLQQEMGDVGDAGDTVDERLWNEEDKPEEDQKGPEKHEKDSTVQVEDKSKLEYEGGGDDGNEGQQDQAKPGKPEQEEPQNGNEQENQPDEEKINDNLDENYEDRQFAQPKDAEPGLDGQEDMDLPEDLNLDGEGDMDEKDASMDQQDDNGNEDHEMPPQETSQDFPEDPQTGNPDDAEQPAQQDEDDDAKDEDMEGDGDAQKGSGEPLDEEMPPADGDDHPQPVPKEEAAQEGEDRVEAGPTGLASNAAQQDQGPGNENQHNNPNEAEAMETLQDQSFDAAGDANEEQQGRAEASQRGGMQTSSAAQDPQAAKPKAPEQEQPNPYHSLGSAVEKWQARLNVKGEHKDAPEDQEAAADEMGSQEDQHTADEYAYLHETAAQQQGDTQALGAATEDQARQSEAVQPPEEATPEGKEPVPMQEDTEDIAAENGEVVQTERTLRSERQAGAQSIMDLDPEMQENEKGRKGPDASAQDEEMGTNEEMQDRDSHIMALLDLISAAEAPEGQIFDTDLPEEQAAAIRAQMDAALQESGPDGGQEAIDLEHGRKMWAACEALTSGLAGDLTEQLRLLLEPTKASRLAGDYRSGKRISMRKVVAYIASHYRKDKIWLRRTRPDKRQYQVVLAIDDSKSMRENGCGTFAMEAVALISKALGRLEVGEVGIVRFGGPGSCKQLHPLDKAFTDEDGPKILAQLQFDQDNTIANRPMMELIVSLRHMLEGARQRVQGGSLARPVLNQLVLIMSDGRFHEKESLRRAVLEASGDKGTLLAFIALDNSSKSLLDMQTVSFVGGKPVLNKYMDTFPFPFYIVLRDIAALPRTLADLLRQWIQLSTA